MAPGFEFEDYQHGDRSSLVAQFPQFADLIISLTR
jgi:predicted cupin superfamily sugar epimerase